MDSAPTHPPAPAGPVVVTVRNGSRRRRIWELPPASHDLLLGLGIAPQLLRATVERALSRLRGAHCRLSGSECDLLFSTVHDLDTRNAVSAAVQRLLDACHARAVRRAAAWRGAETMSAAFDAALADGDCAGDIPGLFWALMTHPDGAQIEQQMLFAIRHWLYRSVRSSSNLVSMCAARTAERDRAVAERDAARLAAAQFAARAQVQAAADTLTIATLRGHAARVEAARAPPPPVPTDAAREHRPPSLIAAPQPPSLAAVAAPRRPVPPAEAADIQTVGRPAPTTLPSEAAAAPQCRSPLPLPLAGRQVLCVGGIQGAVHRYKALVEQKGARFDHHDGGIEDNVQRLGRQLAAADIVLCQAGCVNHEAYRCVKRHCKRFNTPCVYIDRPSLSRFARVLETSASGA